VKKMPGRTGRCTCPGGHVGCPGFMAPRARRAGELGRSARNMSHCRLHRPGAWDMALPRPDWGSSPLGGTRRIDVEGPRKSEGLSASSASRTSQAIVT